MLEVVPYELDEIKNDLKLKAIEEFGLTDAEYEGSSISQLINLLAYSTVINNTNFTFGLNEMFISQAQDRRNVIKHARQMGYSHKRRISYQYKIKLKVLKSGEVTLNKYTNFSSNGNNYVYLGESVLDVYGTYSYLKLLGNEYNNGLVDVYFSNNLSKGNFIITEEGQVCKILNREPVGDPRFLLEVLDGKELPIYSQLGQEIYVTDGTRTNGYRNFIKVGVIDTFVTDLTTKTFKVQMTLEDEQVFPYSTMITHPDSSLVENGTGFSLETDTEYPINALESLTLTDGTEDIVVSLLTLDIQDRNIIIPGDKLDVQEEYTGTDNSTPYYLTVEDNITHKSSLVTAHDMIDGSLRSLSIVREEKTYEISLTDLIVDDDENKITIPAQVNNIVDKDLGITDGLITLTHDTNKITNSVILTDGDGNKIVIASTNFSFNNNSVQLLDDNGDATDIYDDYTAEIDYDYYVKIEQGIVTVNYSYIKDITDFTAKMNYNYIYDNDGYLAKRLFFSDHRGETLNNENDYSYTNPEGWSGFYATSFNTETNVLYFNIAEATQEEIDSGRTAGQAFHNPYVSVEGATPLAINQRIKTPFRKTRFSSSEEILDERTKELMGYKEFDKSLVFSSIERTSVKNELEIIVKEGFIQRWNDQTEDSIDAIQEAKDKNLPIPSPVYINPQLTVNINEDMVKVGHFTVQNDDIENDGIELYMTRLLEDGSIEYDIPWNRRDYLLAEKTEAGDKSFVALSDVDYEDYINIYTKYAGTGTPLSLDMIAKLNVLKSKGPGGATNELISPVDDKNFEAKYYLEDTLTPIVLHIEGTDVQTTDDIRETAPLFSNTANRAVTKNDYKTICEAQQFIQSAQIWGGEEETPNTIPGNIFFSFIPYSRPISYNKEGTKYILKNIDNPELFFTSYYQITGKDRYDLEANKTDQNVLFNLLDNYKIITLQLNYVKPIYMDYKVEVKVLKYKFGQTVDETNAEIFENVRQYFVREIEKFDASFYSSSMIRYMDEKIGDDYGISVNTKFSVDLYDSLYEPDKGTFINNTMNDLTDNDNSLGLVGDNDNWKFVMPIGYPIEDLFEESTIVNNIVTQRGRMIVDNITNCNTSGFIIPGDMLYMELDDGTFISHDINGDLETVLANAYSEVIEINIIYTKNFNDKNTERFKVGSYWIHRTQNIIRLELNTHNYWHIDAQSVVTQEMINDEKTHDVNGNLVLYATGDLGKLIYYKVDPDTGDYILDADGNKTETLEIKETEEASFKNIKKPYTDNIEPTILKSNDGTELYSIRTCPLPRKYFTDKTRTMNINPKKENINSRRNVFSRLKSIEFIS